MSVPDKAIPISLDEISKHFALNHVLRSIKGPLTLRQALGVSAKELGELLGFYTKRRAPTRNTLYVWERVERNARLPQKYAMTLQTREAYRMLLADVVELASGGRYRLRSRMGPRTWRFQVEADCSECGRPFVIGRAGQVRCRRCIAKGKTR